MTARDQKPNPNAGAFRTELFIAQLLRWGVLLSFVIVLFGLGALLATGQTGYHPMRFDDAASLTQYRATPDFPNTLSDVMNGALALKPYAVIALGLLVLIAIPVLRVAVSIIAFLIERDWLYVGITSFVLLMLLVSFAIGEAGG